MGRIVSLLVLVSLFATSAAAFDYEEHKYVSNLAMRIALAGVPAELREKFADISDLASAKAAKENESFGDLVALADSVSDPNPFFTSKLAQPLGSSTVDWKHLRSLKKDLFRGAHAAHNNENHFQELALVAHLNNHESAILEAKEGKWIRAVIFEAYALHFIEDFLSPGHVATGRSGLPDFVAIGLHDRYGARGLDFKLADHRDFRELVTRLGDVDFTQQEGSRLKLEAKDFADLAHLAAKPGEVLKLHGDSSLWENETQAALVVALAARSIREMLLADTKDPTEMLPPGPKNTFDKYCWAFGEEPACVGPYVTIQGSSVLRAASIVYGGYVERVPLVTWFIPGEILILGHENAYVPGRTSTVPDGRWGLLAETLVVKIPPIQRMGPILRDITPSLLVGGSRTFGGQPSNAYYLRAVATIPRTDIQLSAKAGRRTYRLRSAERLTVSTFGIAFEGGFSFVFVRFGGEWERDPKRAEKYGSRFYLSTGISGVIPTRFLLQKLRPGH